MKTVKAALDKSVGPRNYKLACLIDISPSDGFGNTVGRPPIDSTTHDETAIIAVDDSADIDWGVLSEDEEQALQEAVEETRKICPSGMDLRKVLRGVEKHKVMVYHTPPNQPDYLDRFRDD